MDEATKKIARDYGTAIVAAVAVALLIRFYVLEAYRIPTPAMHPTLEAGDTIFVSKTPIGFGRGDVELGDVIVFDNPLDPGHDLIKRVIAKAGDTVQMIKGHVSINGKPLDEPGQDPKAACGREILPNKRTYPICWEQPIIDDYGPEKVPNGSMFVIGDFRSQSPSDLRKRRTWGMIPVAAVKGKARWIWLSVEPHQAGVSPVHFPQFRFERMLRRIE